MFDTIEDEAALRRTTPAKDVMFLIEDLINALPRLRT